MNPDPKNYELAYLLSSSVSEEDILMQVGKLTTLIEENKGLIRHIQEPQKIKLAHAVKKEGIAYFGYTTFTTIPDSLLSLEKKIKSEGIVLRHLLVGEEVGRKPPAFRVFTPRPAQLPRQKVATKEEPKAEEKLDLEALDKKLEEILGK